MATGTCGAAYTGVAGFFTGWHWAVTEVAVGRTGSCMGEVSDETKGLGHSGPYSPSCRM